jgi:hypothetical protein
MKNLKLSINFFRALVLIITAFNVIVVDAQTHQNLQEGDIIFQISKSGQSKAIQLATKSRYSHVGIIHKENGVYYVYEAIQPVKLTKLNDWIKRGENLHYIIKRLKNSHALLTQENIKKMKKAGEKFKGKNYDLYFGWSDESVYCSELVWKIYKETFNIEIGSLQQLRDFDLSNEIVKKKIQERYGNKIPLNENVISPAAIFESPQLETIIGN